jgi:phospholipid/cholesterol/gamma-HCH transport system substrate-binding protein
VKIRDILTFIAFGAMIAVAVAYIGSLGVRIGPPSNRTNVSVDVQNINGLVVDSNVLLSGVPVGKITNIKWGLDGATVDFYIDGKYRVPVDSDIRLENLSALGESYIGLLPRRADGPVMYNGMHITTDKVTQPASISELTTSVVRMLNQADPDALQRVVNEVDTAFPDPNVVLPNIARFSMLIRNTVADMNGRGSVLLDNFQTLLRNAGWVGPLLADITPTVNEITQDTGVTLAGILTWEAQGSPQIHLEFNKFIDRIQKLLDENGGDLKVLGAALLPHLKGVAGALMNFDTGQILTNILATVPEDGTVTLHVAVPPAR